jgi:hypothetical protein
MMVIDASIEQELANALVEEVMDVVRAQVQKPWNIPPHYFPPAVLAKAKSYQEYPQDEPRWAEPTDEQIGLGILLTCVMEARDGLLTSAEAAHVMDRFDKGLLTGPGADFIAAFVYALQARCPHSFVANRIVNEDDLMAFREQHGWSGEGGTHTFAARKDGGGYVHRSRLFFSDFQTAAMARMAF